jgi:rod shape-determining protein MreD
MLPQISLGQAMIQLIASILCYPLVVGASRLAFGVRKPATGEVDAYGRRL